MKRADLAQALRAAGSTVRAEDGAIEVTPPGREAALRAVELLTAYRTRWAPVGGARRPSSTTVRVATRGLRGLLDLWPEDLVCRVGAGTTLGWLEDALAEHRLRLTASAHQASRATVGGAFASADRGLRSAVNAGLRDRVLGATFVDGQGKLVKAGARVVKNVAGYDLARLHHGARGAFGLVVDLVVRLDARPEAERTASWPCPLDALRARLAGVRRPTTEVDPHVQTWLNARASAVAGLGGEPALVAAVEGWGETLDHWARSCEVTSPADLVAVRDLAWSDARRWVFRWAVPPSVWLSRWLALESALDEAGADAWAVGDCLGGEMVLAVRPTSRVVEVMRREAAPLGPVVLDWAASPPAVDTDRPAIGQRLKAAFDPHRLLPDLPAPWQAWP